MKRSSRTHIALLFIAACIESISARQTESLTAGAAPSGANAGHQYTLVVPPGLSSIANHLNNGGNTVAELLPNPPEGTLLYKFDADRQIYTVNQFQFGAWVRPNETLAPGEGAFIRNPGDAFSVTFSGTKPVSAFPQLKGGYNLVSLPVPGETRLPGKPIDQILHLNMRLHVFDDLDEDWSPPLPPPALGESFFYRPGDRQPGPNAVKGGTVYLNNYVPGEVDARFVIPGGFGLGDAWTVQLVAGPPGIAGNSLTPLTPVTTFQTASAGVRGYVHPVVVNVPGVPPGTPATVAVRIFYGPTFETSTTRFQSQPVTVTLGGGVLLPANLNGLISVIFLGFPRLPPRVLQPPVNVTAAAGGQATFSVSATTDVQITYQWLKNGIELPGQTNATLVLNQLQASDAGSYSVRVGSYTPPIGTLDTVTTSPAVLSLLSVDVYPGLTIVGSVGARYRIEYALEANAPSWTALMDVTLSASPYTFSDHTAPARTKRFYRAVLLP